MGGVCGPAVAGREHPCRERDEGQAGVASKQKAEATKGRRRAEWLRRTGAREGIGFTGSKPMAAGSRSNLTARIWILWPAASLAHRLTGYTDRVGEETNAHGV